MFVGVFPNENATASPSRKAQQQEKCSRNLLKYNCAKLKKRNGISKDALHGVASKLVTLKDASKSAQNVQYASCKAFSTSS
jgi:hypothetical protein